MKKMYLKPFIINTLRRASYRWPARNECLKAGRVSRGFYKCNSCSGIFQKRDISLDHVDPVVSLKGFTNWEDYINRMFPHKDGEPNAQGFQILCNLCHDNKTMNENIIRGIHKKKQKKIAKKSKV